MAPVTNTKSQTSPDAQAPSAERRTETQQSDVVGAFLPHGTDLQDIASQQQAVLEALHVEPDLPAPSPTPEDETFAAKEPGETYVGLILPAVQQGHEGIGDEPRALKDALIEADIDETAALLMPATLAAREEAVDPAAFEELAGADANAGAAADKLAPPPSPLAEPNVMIGDGSDDWLTGTGGVDHIYGRGGTDLLYGRGGNDKIYGEGGDDYLFGEGGADWLYGGGGADYMDGGNGADVLVGGNGDDFMIGGFGIDFFNGGAGSDTVAYAYSSASWLVSLSGGFAATEAGTEDLISIENVVMGSGDDLVYGTDGDNDIKGGEGHDTLIGKNGTNELYGEAGNDFLIGGFGTDLYDGGGGNDTVSFSGSNNDVTVSLTTETPQYTGQGTDTF
ncbi:MAG: calcium-binding protein, partial [Methyloligellaceae bacterium]